MTRLAAPSPSLSHTHVQTSFSLPANKGYSSQYPELAKSKAMQIIAVCRQHCIIWRSPFGRGEWGGRGDCRLVGFCFVFQKFASACHYRISRDGKQSSEEIRTGGGSRPPNVSTRGAGRVCHFLLHPRPRALSARSNRASKQKQRLVEAGANTPVGLPGCINVHSSKTTFRIF